MCQGGSSAYRLPHLGLAPGPQPYTTGHTKQGQSLVSLEEQSGDDVFHLFSGCSPRCLALGNGPGSFTPNLSGDPTSLPPMWLPSWVTRSPGSHKPAVSSATLLLITGTYDSQVTHHK